MNRLVLILFQCFLISSFATEASDSSELDWLVTDTEAASANSLMTEDVEKEFKEEEYEITHTEMNALTSLNAEGFPEFGPSMSSEEPISFEAEKSDSSPRKTENWGDIREVLSEPGESPLSPLGSDALAQEEDSPAQIDWKTSEMGSISAQKAVAR